MIYIEIVVFLGSLTVLARARSAETRYYAAVFAIAAAVLSFLAWGQ